MLALLILSSGAPDKGVAILALGFSLIKGIVLAIALIWLSKYLPRFLDMIGHSQEMLYLFSIAWALGISLLVASPLIGLSIEVGGLLAGLTLANSSEHFQISSRLSPLRDFFMLVFFFLGITKASFEAFLAIVLLTGVYAGLVKLVTKILDGTTKTF